MSKYTNELSFSQARSNDAMCVRNPFTSPTRDWSGPPGSTSGMPRPAGDDRVRIATVASLSAAMATPYSQADHRLRARKYRLMARWTLTLNVTSVRKDGLGGNGDYGRECRRERRRERGDFYARKRVRSPPIVVSLFG